jgi:uncharacterized membrane protein YdjX (TVP38/TMEM64 family)
MKTKVWWKKYFSLILVGGAIPTVIILSSYFEISKKASIPIVIILALVFASMALWAYSNRKADGSEWWQDESASGWRGY